MSTGSAAIVYMHAVVDVCWTTLSGASQLIVISQPASFGAVVLTLQCHLGCLAVFLPSCALACTVTSVCKLSLHLKVCVCVCVLCVCVCVCVCVLNVCHFVTVTYSIFSRIHTCGRRSVHGCQRPSMHNVNQHRCLFDICKCLLHLFFSFFFFSSVKRILMS